MTDIFISYASEDSRLCHELARVLGACGWSVWWDRKIIAGQAYDQTIEHALETAKCVVVLWSHHSIASEWVKNEATAAAQRGVLIPALVEHVKLPLEFRRKQTADLIGWNGDASHTGFQALCEGISHTIGGTPRLHPRLQQRPKVRWHRRSALAAIAAMSIALGLGIYSVSVRRTSAPTPRPPLAQNPAPDASVPSGSHHKQNNASIETADWVIGSYYGDVISDAKGSSRRDVTVTISKVDKWTVRVTSDYPRLGTVDVTLTRIDNKILSVSNTTLLILDLEQHPPRLEYNPHGEVAYTGSKR